MQRHERVMLACAIVALIGAAARLSRLHSEENEPRPMSIARSARVRAIADDSLAEAAANVVANDPFRLVNRPSSVRYDLHSDGGSPDHGAIPAAPRPPLALRAIVGGPPWQAIVDGIPGQQPGTIVRTGNTFEKLTVRSVARDTVVIQAPDTTWKLTLRRDQ